MQPDTTRWRLSESYGYLESLPPEGLAWEFLRRNARYQREYNSSKPGRRPLAKADTVKRWGLQFMSDPRNNALDDSITWSPNADPSVLVITGTPDLFESTMPLNIPVASTRKSAGTLRAVTVLGNHSFNLVFATKSKPGDHVAALVPIDGDCLSRIEVLTRFWRALRGKNVPPDTRLTAQQRRRIRLMMQAIDGHHNHATYREIADVIYGAARVASDAWKTSALRDSTIALVKDGTAMVEGEYRQLLKHRRRS